MHRGIQKDRHTDRQKKKAECVNKEQWEMERNGGGRKMEAEQENTEGRGGARVRGGGGGGERRGKVDLITIRPSLSLQAQVTPAR